VIYTLPVIFKEIFMENASATEFESTAGIDPTAFGASLFEPSEVGKEVGADVSSTPASPSSEGSPLSPISTDTTNLSQAEWDALPKAWKKEMEVTWKTASPELRRYVHDREKQVTEGISGYSRKASHWDQVTTPFKHLIENNPDADPAGIIAKLAENHIRIAQATPAERRTYLRQLAQGYGVDFADVAAAADAQQTSGGTDGFTPRQMELLQQTLHPLVETARQNADYVNRQLSATATAEVDKFFSDPKNTFVNEVADDILSLMQKGRAESLPEAYEIAIMRNPSVKARYIASLAAASAQPASQASKLPNVKSSATPRSPGKTSGSIDDTIAGVIAKHFPS
jgi:hypothetical protein